jgi:hypothetical protein
MSSQQLTLIKSSQAISRVISLKPPSLAPSSGQLCDITALTMGTEMVPETLVLLNKLICLLNEKTSLK